MALYDFGDADPQDWFTQQGPVEAPVPDQPGADAEGRTPEALQEALRHGGYSGPATNPATGTSTGGGLGAPTGADPYAIMRQAMAGLPPTGASLDTILQALWAQGIPASRATHGTRAHPQPSDDAIVMPDGTYVDLIQGVGSGGATWHSASGPSGQYDPTRSVIGPGGQITSLNDYLSGLGLPGAPAYTAPKTGTATDPTGQYGMLSGGTGSLADLAAGALTTSPGFQFRLQEGQKALERSAAARGTLLTGGTSKALTRYAQDYASNEYANNYARLFGEQNARYNQLYGLSSLGLNAAGQSAILGSSYAGQAGQLGQTYAGQAGTLGANYAQNQGNLYAQQAGAGADLATQNANAGASSTIGQANANAQGINNSANAANAAMMQFLLWKYLNPEPAKQRVQ